MAEQILKPLDGSKMIRLTTEYIAHLIKDKFKGTAFEVIHERKGENGIHVLQSAMMLICVERGRAVKISFHVAVRCDIAFRIVNDIKGIEEIKSVDVANVFYYDEKESKIYYGLEAEQKMLVDLRIAVLNEFMHEQTELMMLKNMRSPYVS